MYKNINKKGDIKEKEKGKRKNRSEEGNNSIPCGYK